jgi:hypothetical protein
VATFTATSTVCVTGLTVVDTATYWSTLGQVIILLLVQVGGLGFMVLASLLALALSRLLGLRQRLLAQTEINVVELGETRRVLLGVAAFSMAFEVLTAAVLTGRLRLGYGEPFGRAAWYGLFHSVSAFNNAGFALYSDNLVGFVDDGWGEPDRDPGRDRRRARLPGADRAHPRTGQLGPLVAAHQAHPDDDLGAAGHRDAGRPRLRVVQPGHLRPLDVPGKLLAGFFQGANPARPGSARRHGVTVVCIKPEGGSFTYATPETAPGPDDILVAAGATDRVEGFFRLG